MKMPLMPARLAQTARITPLVAVLCMSCGGGQDTGETPRQETPAAAETIPSANADPASIDTTAAADPVATVGTGRSDSSRTERAVEEEQDSSTGVTPPAEETQDAAAILRRAASAYEDVRSMRAGFTMAVDNPLLRTTTNSRGTLYQKSPDRIKLEFSDPDGDVIVGDGTHFWVYYPSVDRNQVIRTPAGEAGASGSVDLRAQFVGNPVTRFDFALEGTEAVAGRPAHILTLVPKQEMGYRQMKVWIDQQDGLARKFDIVEHSGLTRHLQLSSLEINPALGDAVFRFTPPPGARIIER
jgi:outer membrane lipoprotein carrier protein